MSHLTYDPFMALSTDTALADCPETQVGVSLATPLSARLDDLVARANAAGERTSRKELVAALILSAPEEGETLSKRVRALRRGTVQDAVLEGADARNYLAGDAPRPGPRRKQ